MMGYQDTFFKQQNLTLMGTLPMKFLQTIMVFSLPIHSIHWWGINLDLFISWLFVCYPWILISLKLRLLLRAQWELLNLFSAAHEVGLSGWQWLQTISFQKNEEICEEHRSFHLLGVYFLSQANINNPRAGAQPWNLLQLYTTQLALCWR